VRSIPVLVHIFVKVPSQGDSDVTFSIFESGCNLRLPV